MLSEENIQLLLQTKKIKEDEVKEGSWEIIIMIVVHFSL